MKTLMAIIGFMTAIPVPSLSIDEDKFSQSVRFFPLIGLILGLIVALILYLIQQVLQVWDLFIPIYAIALVGLASEVYLSGALHIDGLADTLDGLAARQERDKTLEIMKDSRIGTHGALGLLFWFASKWVLFTILVNRNQLGWIIFSLVFGRFISMTACYLFRPARLGMGSMFLGQVKKTTYWRGVILFILISFLIWRLFLSKFPIFWFAFLIFLASLVSYIQANRLDRKLGGLTGDILGYLLETAQITILILAVLFCP